MLSARDFVEEKSECASSNAASSDFKVFVGGWCEELVAGEVLASEEEDFTVKPETDISLSFEKRDEEPAAVPQGHYG